MGGHGSRRESISFSRDKQIPIRARRAIYLTPRAFKRIGAQLETLPGSLCLALSRHGDGIGASSLATRSIRRLAINGRGQWSGQPSSIISPSAHSVLAANMPLPLEHEIAVCR